jgi:cytochrome c-type biogenesis protein CcmE
MNQARKQRLILIVIVVAFVSAATAMALTALEDNKHLFRTPTQLAAGDYPIDRILRVGGMVVPGSIERATASLHVRFSISDGEASVPVNFEGILPDLFREGQGIVAQGQVDANGTVTASEVLAKHDEEYVPRELRHMDMSSPLADPNQPAAADSAGYP